MQVTIKKFNILFKVFSGDKWFVKIQHEDGTIEGSITRGMIEVKIFMIFIYLLFFKQYLHAMLNDEPVEIKTIEVAASETDKKYNGGKETKTIISKYQ